MKLFHKVAIIGTGLIGGSIGLAIKKHHLADCVVGVSRHQETLLRAKKAGVIDKGSRDLRIIENADLLVLSMPVRAIESLSLRISRIIPESCIVIDVGSTKKELVDILSKIFKRYVGAHPLAGSEKRGVAYAEPGLFNDSLCILTPIRNTDKAALRKIKHFWNCIGAEVLVMDPSAHDKMLAFISHLPHVISFCLMEIIPERYARFAPASLKEATRVAASDGFLWRDIILSNSGNVIRAIGAFQNALSKVRSAAKANKGKILVRLFKNAKNKRELLDGYRNRRAGGRR